MNKVAVRDSEIFPLVPQQKKPMIAWQSERVSYADAHLYEALAFAPKEGYIIVDADDAESVEMIENLLNRMANAIKDFNIPFAYNTTRGKHYAFKLPQGKYFEDFGNTNGGTIFANEDGSKIDVKGNGKGYVKIKDNNIYRAEPQTLKQAFDMAPICPMSLLISKKLKIFLKDYLAKGGRDNCVFSWIPKLRAKGYEKRDWVQLMVELKLIANDPETISETIEWASQKWDSSVAMGDVKDFITDNTNIGATWTKGFAWENVAPKDAETKIWLAKGIDRYDLVSDHLINEFNLTVSDEDEQIWGIKDGLFQPLNEFKKYIKRVVIKDVPNINPTIFGNIENYIEGRIPVKRFSKNRFAVSFMNKTIDVTTMQDYTFPLGIMNQNTIPHNLIDLDEKGYEEEGKFLDQMMEGWTKGNKQIEKELYEMMGLAMTKYMSKSWAYFLLGTGSNGKSWFLEYLTEMLGNVNVSHEDLKELSEDKFASSELYGKLANINFDISADVIEDPSLFKKITSGERISAQNKGLKKFRFAPYALPIFGANNVPYARELGDSDGVNRRIRVIKFNNQFKESGGKEKQKVDTYHTLMSERVIELGIVRAIKAINNALQNGFTTSSVSKKAIEEHKKEMNHLIDFVEESGIKDNESIIDAHKRYKAWCMVYAYTPLTLNHFVKKYENAARYYGIVITKETNDSKDARERHKIMIERGNEEEEND